MQNLFYSVYIRSCPVYTTVYSLFSLLSVCLSVCLSASLLIYIQLIPVKEIPIANLLYSCNLALI